MRKLVKTFKKGFIKEFSMYGEADIMCKTKIIIINERLLKS